MKINEEEVYTLEQLRKMNQLDGDKKLMFLPQVINLMKKIKGER